MIIDPLLPLDLLELSEDCLREHSFATSSIPNGKETMSFISSGLAVLPCTKTDIAKGQESTGRGATSTIYSRAHPTPMLGHESQRCQIA